MSSIIHSEDRYTFPIWRRFADSLKRGELDPIMYKRDNTLLLNTERAYEGEMIQNWGEKPNFYQAAEILNYGIMHNKQESTLFQEAAQFVVDNNKYSGESLHRLAINALNIQADGLTEELVLSKKSYHINEIVKQEIRRYKRLLQREPKFASGWIEIARLYLILGQREKAENAINFALMLSPNDRFVLRSATRFFTHYGDFDQALYHLTSSYAPSKDPWILSAILGVSKRLQKSTMHISKARKLQGVNSMLPYHLTELNAALATIELFDGNRRRAKKLFQNSLIQPNDNSLAQSYWYSFIEPNEDSNLFEKTLNPYEAKTLQKYRQGKVKDSYKYNLKWILAEPFSVRPFLAASYNSLTFLEDFEETERVARLGLKINPNNPALQNNLAYALIMGGGSLEAKKILENIDKNQLENTVFATKGLYEFRFGDSNLGREYYKKAIIEFQAKKDYYREAIAYVNYAREEVIIESPLSEEVIHNLNNRFKERKELDFKHLLASVNDIYNKKVAR